MSTDSGRFTLLFNKMALIFLRELIVFTVSSFEFQQVIANDEWPQFTQPQSTGLSDLGAMLESYYKLQQKPKIVPEFKMSVKDYRKRLQTCVLANGGHFEHIM